MTIVALAIISTLMAVVGGLVIPALWKDLLVLSGILWLLAVDSAHARIRQDDIHRYVMGLRED